jgi:hypothetical protein
MNELGTNVICVKPRPPVSGVLISVFLLLFAAARSVVLSCVLTFSQACLVLVYPAMFIGVIVFEVLKFRRRRFEISSQGFRPVGSTLVQWSAVKEVIPRYYLSAGVDVLTDSGKLFHFQSGSEGFAELLSLLKEHGLSSDSAASSASSYKRDMSWMVFIAIVAAGYFGQTAYFFYGNREKLLYQANARGCNVAAKMMILIGAGR